MGAVDTSASNNDPTTGVVASVDVPARDRTRYQPLVLILLAAAAGMVLDRYGRRQSLPWSSSPAEHSEWFVAAWTCCAGSLAVWWFAWRRRRDAAAAWLLLAAVLFAGAAWHDLNWFLFDREDLSRYASYTPAPTCITALACASPERVSAPPPTPLRAIPGGERSRMMVNVTGIRDGREWRPASGLCQVAVEGHLLGVHPGDELQLFGQLARPAPPLNPGEFDFAAHARADRQLSRFRSSAPECVMRVAAGSSWSPRYWLDVFRTRAKQLVRTMIGPQRAGLAAAILLGAREGLSYGDTEPYLETGTIHVLVVSGMNVAILAVGLLGLMRMGWLSRRAGLCVIVAVVVVYSLLAEAQPPVVRAAVLGVLGCVAIWMGRRGSAFNSLFAAAIVVLAINPNDLFRAGPQLSFLAVGVLIWFGNTFGLGAPASEDPLDQLLEEIRPWYSKAFEHTRKWSWALLLTSAAVWLLSLPLVLSAFHIVSPIAIPASLAIWPLVTVAMWSGFLMVVIGWLVPPVGHLFGGVCNWSLGWLETLVNRAEAVPYGHFWAPGPAWWWVVAFYLGALAAMIWGKSLPARRWQVAALAVWILVGLAPPLTRTWTRDGLESSFVAVGHGACVVVESPDGRTLLYDAGAIGSPEYATQSIASYLWERGVMRIDGIVISHADIDHYNAVPGLLERFRIGAVYVSPVMFSSIGDEKKAGGVKVLRDAIDHAGVPIHEIWSGNRLNVGTDVSVRILHPPERGIVGSDNANSIVAAVEYGGRRLLLPGDLESPGLEDVMSEEPYDCDVLLAPHHGSRRSDPPGFAAWSTPEYVVISGGGNDEIETVVQAYEKVGAAAFATTELGTICVHVSAAGDLRTVTWRDPQLVGTTKFHGQKPSD